MPIHFNGGVNVPFSPYSWMKYLLPSIDKLRVLLVVCGPNVWVLWVGSSVLVLNWSVFLLAYLFFIRARIFLCPKRLSDLAVRLILL